MRFRETPPKILGYSRPVMSESRQPDSKWQANVCVIVSCGCIRVCMRCGISCWRHLTSHLTPRPVPIYPQLRNCVIDPFLSSHFKVPLPSRKSFHVRQVADIALLSPPVAGFKHVCNRWCGRTRNTTCVINSAYGLLKLKARNCDRTRARLYNLRMSLQCWYWCCIYRPSASSIAKSQSIFRTLCVHFRSLPFLHFNSDKMKISLSLVAVVFGTVGVAIASPVTPSTPLTPRQGPPPPPGGPGMVGKCPVSNLPSSLP
jgi:hypothetical protein